MKSPDFTRRGFIQTLGTGAAAMMGGVHLPGSLLMTATKEGQMKQKRPNLVFVFPDQYRQQAIGYMNQDPVVTPNLDGFAAEI